MSAIEYSSQQIRAAKRAAKALKELTDSGLYLIWHTSGGEIYGVPRHMKEEVEELGPDYGWLECGIIHDGGDW